MADLIQIPKPELGRPNDSRLTQAYLDARPELKGLTPFNPATDFDLVDTINDRLGQLHALVQYADADLYGQMMAARDRAEQDHQQVVDSLADIAEAQQVTEQQIADVQALAAAFGGNGFMRMRMDPSGAIVLSVFEPARIVFVTQNVPLVGNMVVPVVTAPGGTA